MTDIPRNPQQPTNHLKQQFHPLTFNMSASSFLAQFTPKQSTKSGKTREDYIALKRSTDPLGLLKEALTPK